MIIKDYDIDPARSGLVLGEGLQYIELVEQAENCWREGHVDAEVNQEAGDGSKEEGKIEKLCRTKWDADARVDGVKEQLRSLGYHPGDDGAPVDAMPVVVGRVWRGIVERRQLDAAAPQDPVVADLDAEDGADDDGV